MKNKMLLAMVCAMVTLTACGTSSADVIPDAPVATTAEPSTEEKQEDGSEVANSIFAIHIPNEFADMYIADISDEEISIFYKDLKESIGRGYLFSVRSYERQEENIGGMYRKIGEVTTSDGKTYSLAIGYPSEAQWDIDNEENPPADYDKFYNAAEDIVKNITGVNGGTFVYRGGCKGEDLYGDVLSKYIEAAGNGWDANEYEANDMSPEIFSIVQNGGIENVGYAYVDTNLDGIDELVIGEIGDSELKGTIYDIYAMVNGVPTHVISGSARDRYYVYGSFIVNEASGGALESYQNVYSLEPNSTEFTLQWATKYDGYENEDQPWFISYVEDEWENVSEEDYTNRMVDPSNYTALDFKSL